MQLTHSEEDVGSMMANGLPISLDSFRKLPPEEQTTEIFKTLLYMHTSGYECEEDRDKRLSICEARFRVIEKRKWGDRGLSGIAGGITGFLAGLWK